MRRAVLMGFLVSCAGKFIVLRFSGLCGCTDCAICNFRLQFPGSDAGPVISPSSDGYSLSISPRFIPLQSAGKITLGGAYSVGPTWPSQVDTSLFVVGRGDVQSDCVLLLSPVNLCVQLGILVSHQRDYSLFTTSFVVFRDLESGLTPPFLAIPHFLRLPTPRSLWTRFLCRIDWRRSRLRDISRLPVQVVVNQHIKKVWVAKALVAPTAAFEQKLDRGRRGLGSDSASDGCMWDDAGSIMSGSEEADRSESGSDDDGSDVTRWEAGAEFERFWVEPSEAGSSASSTPSLAGYTDSIEDLVGAAWLCREGWRDEVPDC